jgi:hypothetical protein
VLRSTGEDLLYAGRFGRYRAYGGLLFGSSP